MFFGKKVLCLPPLFFGMMGMGDQRCLGWPQGRQGREAGVFQKDDYVNYGTQGICHIEDIRFIRFDCRSGGRDYYILRPVHQDGSRVFVPTDNPQLTGRMRPVLSPGEIDRIIRSVRVRDLPWISDQKQRSARFQDILVRRDEEELLLLARCLYQKSREGRKGLSSADAQTLKKVEEIVEREFAFSLRLDLKNVGLYIRRTLGLAEPSRGGGEGKPTHSEGA